jgi:mono/diheme cytochrome c family protein
MQCSSIVADHGQNDGYKYKKESEQGHAQDEQGELAAKLGRIEAHDSEHSSRRYARPMSWRRLGWPLLIFAAMQVVPYGRDHTNPATTAEPKWNAPGTRALFRRACFDCHSNETVWPWYANVAPVSWLVQNDVEGGRLHLNFSEWDRPQRHAADVALEVREGAMPPAVYLPLHASAKLSDAERAALIAGAEASLGKQNQSDARPKLFQ